ncbi:MAG: 3-deoxy-7-phosphoheptulonate synthase [Proteobacteria bacterium]|nr:3-deoxy-7-phosphoheptulonate synthase [Pseudomonadota bacterium]
MQTDNLRITRTHPLISPAVLQEDLPLTDEMSAFVAHSRDAVSNIINSKDKRLLVIVGPCSIHDPIAAMDYADRFVRMAEEVQEKILCVMRVYFEKPRTTVGWKGLINDPDLDGTHRINKGLRMARQLLSDLTGMRVPAATEFLDTTFGQYYTDMISWGAIGARTVESQIHRQLASGLSMPVGVKNRTDGDVNVAIDAMKTIAHTHLFPSLTKEGAPAILETAGNPDCHLVLRGGHQPNYHPHTTVEVYEKLSELGLNQFIMVDCSHANSDKQPERQVEVALSVVDQLTSGRSWLGGLMIESHINAGSQAVSANMKYGQSITDGCLSFSDTRDLLVRIASRLSI